MSYSWFRQGTCTVGASDVVRFQGANITTAPNKPVVGDAFTVVGFRFYEIIFIGSDATGEYIRLNRAYEEAAGSNISYAVARFSSGTQNAKLVAMASAAINQKQISLDDMYEWYTSQEDTVQFLGPDGTFTTLTTYFKLSQEITAVGGNSGAITVVANNINDVKTVAANIAAVNLVAPSIPAINTVNTNMPAIVAVNADMVSVKNVSDNMADVKDAKPQADRAESEADRAEAEADKAMMAVTSLYAMSQAQFEAIRAQNNEEFAASGFVHFGKHRNITPSPTAGSPINEGLWAKYDVSNRVNTLCIGAGPAITFLDGKSKTSFPVVNIAGTTFNIVALNEPSPDINGTIKFPEAPDGKTTYNKSTGVNTVHATVTAAFNAQAADPTNVEVVTDRVDMWGFEAWLEEVNTTNPYVYPNGLIQSQATTMEGIATSASARPVTYYAVFDGYAGSKGKGLNFFALTDAQKKKVLGNHKNNLYYLDDGRLVQWRLRQRTIAGAGNGDWLSLSPALEAYNVRFTNNNNVSPQGIRDTSENISQLQYYYSSSTPPQNIASEAFYNAVGAYQIRPSSGGICGVSGQCYFLVCGTVNRLNSGFYHPSLNASGSVADSTGKFWYNTALSFTTQAHCFDLGKISYD